MIIAVDEHNAEAKSRLVMVSLVTLTLRLMERWRQSIHDAMGIDPDYETTMILGAIVAISSEKFMRASLEPFLETLENPFPLDLLTKCNVSSVAAAAGLNRETTRRKIKQLEDAEIVIRVDHSFRIADPLFQLPILRETLRTQLETLRRAIDELGRLGVVQTKD